MVIARSVTGDKKVIPSEKQLSIAELESILPTSLPDLDTGQVCLLKDSPFRLIRVSG